MHAPPTAIPKTAEPGAASNLASDRPRWVTILADAATRLALEARLRDEGDKIWAGDYVDERIGHRVAALQGSHRCGFVFHRWCIAAGHPIPEGTNFNINCRGPCFAAMDLDMARGGGRAPVRVPRGHLLRRPVPQGGHRARARLPGAPLGAPL